MSESVWKVQEDVLDTGAVDRLIEAFSIHKNVAKMLVRRGITSVDDARRFFDASLEERYNPFLMKGVQNAVLRIERAIVDHERIVVYGDYDVDGITSTSVLVRCLKSLGAIVDYYIPERIEEGYGMNGAALDHLIDAGYRLLISVDCGISSVDLVAAYNDRLDMIITDHHNPPESLPPAVAVIDPKQEGCAYPDKNLAGVGVAYTLCRALWQRYKQVDYTRDLELVALGTVADVVPLLDENRIYVREGLAACADTDNVGMVELLAVCGIARDAVTSDRIGFSLAPRLNAAGRIARADMGVRLLTTDDPVEAKQLAQDLYDINSERQQLERMVLIEAEKRVETLGDLNRGVLVVDGSDWHPGVIGIVASRLLDKYHRPVIMISIKDGVGKASCRSIPALDLYGMLKAHADCLIQFGGHRQAAGFTIEAAQIPAFRAALQQYADQHLTAEDYLPILDVEQELNESDLTLNFVKDMNRLAPFGEANRSPLFVSRYLTVEQAKRIGADYRHLKLVLASNKENWEAIAWRKGELAGEIFEGDEISMVYSVQINAWQNRERVQEFIEDVRVEKTVPVSLSRDMLLKIFKAIRFLLTGRERTSNQLEILLTEQTNLSYSRKVICLAIKVFCELGLMERITQEDMVYYRLVKVTEKRDLSMSKTYMEHQV